MQPHLPLPPLCRSALAAEAAKTSLGLGEGAVPLLPWEAYAQGRGLTHLPKPQRTPLPSTQKQSRKCQRCPPGITSTHGESSSFPAPTSEQAPNPASDGDGAVSPPAARVSPQVSLLL